MNTTAAIAPETLSATSHAWSPSDGRVVGWETESEWARQLAARDDRLSAQHYAILVPAVRNGHPVVLTTRSTINGREFHDTQTVIVSEMHLHTRTKTANRLRVRSWGGGHDIWLHAIVDIKLPASTLAAIDN